ncbi:methyl-accepting chemotaxis protein [Desulfosporosinus sp. PR]|uniref:methyl-accepting chemotaxis protein n=1 Tax=Candidatus Desulfosporosinus nitrosoreducens TaxID=3401928 RepID=UPI0027EF545D|nr:methyl-accepting chemotaxis protein [Desulfosporosinus sp. PR]MDQ7095267.1 methyl-accepting chemotaxis protein [Desulfosporosinus sp. PR]
MGKIRINGINQKIIVAISSIAIIVFLIVGFVFMNYSQSIILDATNQKLSLESRATANQLNELLSGYSVLVKQMATNQELKTYMSEIQSREEVRTNPLYKEVVKTLQEIQNTDENKNIALTWVALDEASYLVTQDNWDCPTDWDIKSRPWYNEVFSQKDVVYTDPYVDKVTGKMVISVMKPIFDNSGNRLGVVAVDVTIDQIAVMMKKVKVGSSGYAFLLSKNGDFIYHPDPQKILKLNIKDVDKSLSQRMMAGETGLGAYTFEGIKYQAGYAPLSGTGWSIGVVITDKEYRQDITRINFIIFFVCGIGLMLMIFATWFISSNISKSLKVAVEQCDRMANGNFTATMARKYTNRKDEIGHLAEALNKMTNNLKAVIIKVKDASEQLASASQEFSANVDHWSMAANQVAASITDVAKGAKEQLVATNDTTAVMEQMTVRIQQVAANANQVARQSVQVDEKAKDSSKSVDKAVVQMANIEKVSQTAAAAITKVGEQSKRIGQIVDTISDIAGQTNLLALNAAIEAARAGEQGKGFAVVAEEVRKLAEGSQNAAKQIAELIEETQKDTDQAVTEMEVSAREVKLGTEVVAGVGGAFQEIEELVTKVSTQVGEISEAIYLIVNGSQQIVGSVEHIDELSKKAAKETQTVSAVTEEQSASMEEIAAASHALAELAQDLQVAVSTFQL